MNLPIKAILISSSVTLLVACGDSSSSSAAVEATAVPTAPVVVDQNAEVINKAIMLNAISANSNHLSRLTLSPFRLTLTKAISSSSVNAPILSNQIPLINHFVDTSGAHLIYDATQDINNVDTAKLPSINTDSAITVIDQPPATLDPGSCGNSEQTHDNYSIRFSDLSTIVTVQTTLKYKDDCQIAGFGATHHDSTFVTDQLTVIQDDSGQANIYQWVNETINATYSNDPYTSFNSGDKLALYYENNYGFWVDTETKQYYQYFDYSMVLTTFGLIVEYETVTPIQGDAITGGINASAPANLFNVKVDGELIGTVSYLDDSIHIVFEPNNTVIDLPYNELTTESSNSTFPLFGL